MSLDRTKTVRRRITIAAVVIVGAALIYFFTRYGTWRVIPGMDTMSPDIPAGSTCIVQKNPGAVPVGSVVVLELPDGAGLLSRVASVDGSSIRIRHDNRASRFLSYESAAYPMEDVRGLVLTTFLPDVPSSAPVPRDRK